MSLVAYGSSDDSDSEETSTSAAPESRVGTGGLFSLLPAPKKTGSAGGDCGPSKETKTNPSAGDSTSSDDLDPQPSKGGLFSSLPKPKKRTEPVKITVPQIQRRDSDSDDDEPAKKKLQPQGAGSGLSSLLPQPKNLTVKEIDRPLIPHALTKRQEPKGPKSGTPAQGLLGTSASPSAIKAAAKSAALQVARQIATDDQDNEEDITPQNYFSLGESSQPLPAVVPNVDPEPGAPAEVLPLSPADEPGQSNAPLDFGGNHEGAGAWGGQYPQYQQPMAGPEAFPSDYYNEPYYQDPNPGLAEAEEPGHSAMFDDEAFMRLQGKRNRGKEEVKFLEIKGDDQLSGNQQWMTKSMTEEKQTRQSFSKKKGEQPTGQQRRKHQITYLIHQLWVLADARTSYAVRVQPYTGKDVTAQQETDSKMGLGQRVVLELTEGLPAGHTVVMDNFFTSFALGEELAKRKLAMLGTIRRHKPELPPALLVERQREVLSSVFAHTATSTAVSYLAKGMKRKLVLLLSTRHRQAEVSAEPHRKPVMILDYNRTKGGVDHLDQAKERELELKNNWAENKLTRRQTQAKYGF